ncbi:dihydrolipoyllysine-residue acetyltransferase [Thalassolituus alkanivorans]|uniref:dihydrolipoyllysine-residue acetyltransferase n=1 Tax=Thalassolituus alkanivorans TaxID=2881055 RepID=UPI001E47DD5E|nr:dihydrolipoyllysine-residue acetyltransferase [Thalassolituus alkanivorans]MCB2385881.1 dihydrolipoyllysine-residue acetyltransferase [Thalassolituus alkanivorans]MCB2421731.1 dihydrolipoyllysine-residue acetyltransferase [Thalassolituus alkanivorans]
MSKLTVTVPDIGGAENVEIIEINVAVGDSVNADQDLLVLETDKATMEIPCPQAGKVQALLVKVGDKVSEGSAILELESADSADTEQNNAEQISAEPAAAAQEPAPAAPAAEINAGSAADSVESLIDLVVPDLGGASEVTVIELCARPGDTLSADDSLIVLESDKASMDIPAPQGGTLKELLINIGDKVKEGQVYGRLLTQEQPGSAASAQQTSAQPALNKAVENAPAPTAAAVSAVPVAAAPVVSETTNSAEKTDIHNVYAGPSSRRLARQLGVDLTKVKGTGDRSRITKDDIRDYVKALVKQAESGVAAVTSGAGIPAVPAVDFAQFGEIELQLMSKIKKVTAANMSRNWLNVPHVTQFDEADITDLDAFRASMKAEAEKQGVKLTPLPFLIKAAASALTLEPSFNVSLHHDGEHMVQKHYVHIGIACDTPNGLMVPVLRDADKKGIYQIAREASELIEKARNGKLKPNEMQGGCFTISSLGAMGGTGFTPIVNAPEVAIMGVSKAQIKPQWNGKEFVPRNMLPLAVSYDHRAINGADCGRFFTTLVALLSDVRRLIL